jgi:hypothetical protein
MKRPQLFMLLCSTISSGHYKLAAISPRSDETATLRLYNGVIVATSGCELDYESMMAALHFAYERNQITATSYTFVDKRSVLHSLLVDLASISSLTAQSITNWYSQVSLEQPTLKCMLYR